MFFETTTCQSWRAFWHSVVPVNSWAAESRHWWISEDIFKALLPLSRRRHRRPKNVRGDAKRNSFGRLTPIVYGMNFCVHYLPRHEVDVAGNILLSGTVHGICTVSFRYLSVCKFKPPFNISGMDAATLFKFGKWIGTASPTARMKNSPERGVVCVT